MASLNRSARSAAKSNRGLSLRIVLGALLSCSAVAGSAWGLATTLGAMHEAARVASEGSMQFKIALVDGPRLEAKPKAIKSARAQKAKESELRAGELTAELIMMAHKRSVAAQLAMVDSRKKADEAVVLASAARAKASPEADEKADGKPSIVTALVEDVPVQESQPFDLVLANPETDDEDAVALPSDVPLPEARPMLEKAEPDEKPTVEKPLATKTPDKKSDVAVAKPDRSFFGGLFNRSPGEAIWPGNSNRVAIYDVTNATVYMPDGSKLRAHSGIGNMRDNPRYENVSMRGPTPAGIYRLSMREQRFYGVEAIRMTSIDGRDPKNRTGLLTHTNLLRGRIGSHGCVAFQNYQPFLNAFKRGQVKMLVVVPELPSSPTQLAALYRKAGA